MTMIFFSGPLSSRRPVQISLRAPLFGHRARPPGQDERQLYFPICPFLPNRRAEGLRIGRSVRKLTTTRAGQGSDGAPPKKRGHPAPRQGREIRRQVSPRVGAVKNRGGTT
jgi:hypothetical protein